MIKMDDVNAILKGLINMDLNDIADIAGDKGEKLVDLINGLIGSVEITDKDTELTATFNLLPRDFFEQIAAYGISYTSAITLSEGEVGYDYQPEHKYVDNFTIDGTDALMYVLKTVCSDEFLKTLATKIGKDVNEPDLIANIILGLAGKQENIVDILVTLLTEYTVTYDPFTRPALDKIDVEHNEPTTEESLQKALAALDPILAAVIPMLVKDKDGNQVESLKALLTGLLEDLDIANMLMELLVPVLAGLDIDEILGYVNDLTNLEIALNPQAFKAGTNGSQLATFIGDAETWQDVLAAHFTATEFDAEGKATKYELTSKFDWKLGLDKNFDGLVAFVCDLLAPLDPVLELLLVGATLKVIPDTDATDGIDEIEIVGGKGYNYAIIPLLEALGVVALSEAEYIDAAEDDGYLKPILTALIAKVDTLLDKPVETLIPMLANIFYFIGTNGINNIAKNLLAFANYLLVKVDPVFHIGVAIDLGAAKILDYELGEGDRLEAGVKINVNPADLIDLVNGLLDGLKVVDTDGDGEKDPLGISLDINWLNVAAQMAAVDENGDIIEIETSYVDYAADGSAVEADWYNIIGDPEDTFTTLINTILTEENTYAIAELVTGLLGTALDGMDGKVTKTQYTDAEGKEYFFADAEVKEEEDKTFTATYKDEDGKDVTVKGLTKVMNGEEAVTKEFDDASELNLKGLISDILYSETGLRSLISAVVLLLSGQYDINTYPTEFKYLGVLSYFLGVTGGADKQTSLNTAISKLDAIIAREAPGLIAMFIKEDATKPDDLLQQLRAAAVDAENLSEMVDTLLEDLLLTTANYDAIIGAVVKAISGFLTADLCGTLKDLLGIDLMPVAYANATGNADIKAYVNAANAGEDNVITWAEVWAAHSDADGKHVAYSWNLEDNDGKITVDTFVDAVLDLLKPLNSILDFILADGAITLIPDEEGKAAITLPGGNAYNTALVPLFKALGVDLEALDTENGTNKSTTALKQVVNGLISRDIDDKAVGLVTKISEAPLETILKLVAGLSYLLANDNLEPIIKNLLAPVFSILDLLEPVVSRAQIDDMLKKFLVIDNKAYGLTDLIEIGNNGGANLVGLLNGLIGGLKVTDKDGNVVDTINLLPSDFFVTLSKYAVDVKKYDKGNDEVGTSATGHDIADTYLNKEAFEWDYDAGETLMYILDTVLSDNFLKVLANMLKADATVTGILTGLADKEMPIVELILMLLDNYTVSYNKIPQENLAGGAADYSAFTTNADKVESTLPDAIVALDALVPTILGFIEINGTKYGSLAELVNGLLANADLGKVLMELLVPVLAGLDIDEILGYVNELTNLEIAIDPQTFATSAIHGSKLADFIGDAETWKDVLSARFDVTYKEDGETIDKATLKTVEVENADGTKTTVPAFDFGIKTLDDIVKFASDLLMPLDVVFQVLLSGGELIALPDAEDADPKNEIKIKGGYGYNYAIVPLLEALGATPISQAEFEAQAATQGSLKPVLDVIVARVNAILAAPISEVLGLVANLFYFIGSDGVNTIVKNLVAPVVELLDAVCEVYPIGIKVAIEDGKFALGIDYKNEGTVPAGFNFDISADELASLLEGLVAGIKIDLDKDGTADELGLAIDLDWLAIAAAMAKRDADGKIIYTNSAMDYNYNGTVAEGDGNDPYKNISGDAADSLVTLLNVILTKDNVAAIKEIVLGLLGDAELDPTLENLIHELLSDEDGIINLVGTVILVLTGEYDINVEELIFYFLGDKDYNYDEASVAIETLDRLLGKAVPVVLPLIVGEDVEEGSLLDKINKAAANVPAGTPVLTHIINTLLNEFVFTQDMMNTVTDLVVGTIGGFLSESLCGTLNDLLDIDLSPAGFAEAANNSEFNSYIASAVTAYNAAHAADEGFVAVTSETISWAAVKEVKAVTTGTGDDAKTTYGTMFTLTEGKEQEEFLGNIYDVLQVAEPVLAFLLTGGDLNIAEGYDVENIKLKGNNGYENAIYYLYKGLGIDQMGADWVELAEGDDAIDALSNTIDYVLALVDAIGKKPVDTIITLVANLSYLIANDGVEVVLSNLVSPVLSLVDALDGTISRAELDALIESLVKVDLLGKPLNITNILTIAGDNGKVLVDLLNNLLGGIEIKDANGNTIQVIKALPDDFFRQLAIAAIEVTDPATGLVADVTVAKTWKVNTGDALMYILETALSRDFLQILTTKLNLEEGTVKDIVMSLADKEEEVIEVLLSLLVKYLVEYKTYKQQAVVKETVITEASTLQKFESVVTNIDALIPTVLSLLVKNPDGSSVGSLKELVTGLIADADLGSVLMELLVPLLAGLPSETIDMVLGYVTELTNLKDLDIAPQAFAEGNFGSKLTEFIGDAETWADVLNARFDVTYKEDGKTIDKATLKTKTVKDAEGKDVTVKAFDFGITTLDALVAFVCDLTGPLDPILALLLQGGQVKKDFLASGETSVGKSLSVLDEINVMGGNGYNYAIIPLLELLGIKADSQDVYNSTVAANNGSVLYPILKQLITKVDEILDSPVEWVASILANLFYVIGNDDITTIVDNLLAPVNMLIAKVDKLFPIAIDINLADIGNETETDKVVDVYLGKKHDGLESGIHVRVTGAAIATLLNNVLAGIEINGVKLLKDDGIDFNWLELAAKCGAAGTDGNVKTRKTALSGIYDEYNADDYKVLVGGAADTFSTVIAVVLESINIEQLIDSFGLDESIKDLINDLIKDPSGIIDAITDLLSGTVSYQPVQNRPLDISKKVDYSTYLTFTEENANIIVNNIDQLIIDILDKAGLGSIEGLVSGFINDALVNNLLNKIFGLLAGDSVAPILNTVKGLEFHVLNSQNEELSDANKLVVDLTVEGFYKAIGELDLAKEHSYMKAFYDKLGAALANKTEGVDVTWADVGSMEGINWGIDSATNLKSKLTALTKAFAGVLTPLNDILELLLIGEGKYLNVLGIVTIAGGDGYDYAIIPLLEAFGLKASEVKTELEYKQYVSGDQTRLLGYILDRVVYFADGLLDKPVDSLLTILPNLAYFLSNDGLLLTVKNLLAPVYHILNLLLPILGISLESYLNLEKLLHSLDLGIVIFDVKYDFHIPEINWLQLAEVGGKSAKEVATSRSNPGAANVRGGTGTAAGPWANSFKERMTADQYAGYVAGKDLTNASLYKTTQTAIEADKAATLTYVFTYLFEMFSEAGNREALVQWIVDFFALQSGAEQTVRYAINELFNQATIYNAPDMIVSVLFYLLGMGVVIDASLMGNVAQIQAILDQLYGAMGTGGCAYSSIAKIMQDLTGVWDDTVGDDQDHEDAVEDVEESLNWFQRLLKKIKEFFQKIFSIFK